MRRAGLGLAIGAILALTLLPSPSSPPTTFGCLICGSRGTADAILNTLLFLPLGVTARLVWPAIGALLSAPVLSFLIEGLQLFIPGRDASLGDLLFNSLGGGLGVLVLRGRHSLLRAAGARAALLCGMGGLLASGVIGATGWLLQPALTRSPYYGQWTPDLGHLEAYGGELLAARVARHPVPQGRSSRTDALRRDLSAGAEVEVTAVVGPPTTALAPVFSIYDEREREILLLGADGSDLVFRMRRRASSARLDAPDVRLAGALRDARAGDTLRLSARHLSTRGGERDRCLAAVPGRSACGVGPSAGEGWALLFYPEHLGWLRGAVSAAWIGALLIPVGFWLRGTLRPGPDPSRGTVRQGARLALGLGAVLLPFVALAWVPRLTVLVRTPLREYAGGVGGLLVGVLVALAAARLGSRARGAR
ncbi:MAG: VanZ family protein [Gemmatimonadota bacterium]